MIYEYDRENMGSLQFYGEFLFQNKMIITHAKRVDILIINVFKADAAELSVY